jgi:hypothetical protein
MQLPCKPFEEKSLLADIDLKSGDEIAKFRVSFMLDGVLSSTQLERGDHVLFPPTAEAMQGVVKRVDEDSYHVEVTGELPNPEIEMGGVFEFVTKKGTTLRATVQGVGSCKFLLGPLPRHALVPVDGDLQQAIKEQTVNDHQLREMVRNI